MKSALDFDRIPAKFCVSLRKLLNRSVHQIVEIMLALNLRVVAGIKEMIPVKSLMVIMMLILASAAMIFMKSPKVNMNTIRETMYERIFNYI